MIKEMKSGWGIISRTGWAKFMKLYGSRKNIKTIGILSAIGMAGFLAFKFIPWNKITDKFEVNFDEAFGESKFNLENAAEGII